MSRYYGEVINLSLRDISMLKKFKIVDIKKRFLGLVKIYTVELPSKKIEEIAKDFQSNMSTSLKKEWYITFHNRERVIVIFRTRIFDLSGKGITPIHGKMLDISHAEDKENWNELISYAKKLGVPNSQCDFLPEDFSKRTFVKGGFHHKDEIPPINWKAYYSSSKLVFLWSRIIFCRAIRPEYPTVYNPRFFSRPPPR